MWISYHKVNFRASIIFSNSVSRSKYFIFAVCFTVRQWETFGQAKVALKAPEGGEEALKLLQNKAKGEGLASVIIRDAGRTQIESGTATVLGIGMQSTLSVNQMNIKKT